MSTSGTEPLIVDLTDGRTITVPLVWFPRLAHGTPAERANWRLIGAGVGIHWPDWRLRLPVGAGFRHAN